MSLLGTQVFANPTTPIWAAVGTGGGATGPTGPAGSTGATGPAGPTGGGGGTIAIQTLTYQVPLLSNGGGPVTGSLWYTRPLNTGSPALSGSNSTTISGMSLNLSNAEITLPSGSFYVNGSVGGEMIVNQGRIYVSSGPGAPYYILGTVEGADSRTSYSVIQGAIVGPAVCEVQFAGLVSNGDDRDWGSRGDFDSNVYTTFSFTKTG